MSLIAITERRWQNTSVEAQTFGPAVWCTTTCWTAATSSGQISPCGGPDQPLRPRLALAEADARVRAPRLAADDAERLHDGERAVAREELQGERLSGGRREGENGHVGYVDLGVEAVLREARAIGR